MKRRPHKPHWYFQVYSECGVCGSRDDYRVRRYDPKPKDPDKRWAYQNKMCNCLLWGAL